MSDGSESGGLRRRIISVGLDHAKAVLSSCFVSILDSTFDYVLCLIV